MEAIQLTACLKQYLQHHKMLNGQVHSVFENAFNIVDNNGNLIGVLTSKKEMSPFSVQVNCESFNHKSIAQGNEVLITQTGITLKNRRLKIAFNNPNVVSLKIQPIHGKTYDQLEKKLEVLKASIISHGSKAGISELIHNIVFLESVIYKSNLKDLNDYSEFIYDRLIKLLNTLKEKDHENFLYALPKIVGFGPGLTPSADDYLSGIISILYKVSLMDSEGLALVYKTCIGKTTQISEEMIRHSTHGILSESSKVFIDALFDDSKEVITEEVLNVMQIGSTSGTDFLFGTYCMARLISKKEA